MKSKFSKGDAVTTNIEPGTVKEVAPFADHFEYLVEFKDQTASWIHEQYLKPAATSKPATETATPK